MKSFRRRQIFERDGRRCVYCARDESDVILTIDHVEPRMRGGDHSDGNIVACCQSCNEAKGGQPAWAFLEDRPVLRDNFLRRARHLWPRLRQAVLEAAGES